MFADRIDLYRQIEQERQSKLLVYVTGDRPGMETQISQDVHDLFLNHLDRFNLPPKITLYLYTRGGDTMAAWGFINLLRQFCQQYEVIIPSKARSAGTLICLGADNIIMTKQATLGPIDPSLNSHLNPQNPAFPQNPQARVPVSVESIKGYFDYAKEELGIVDAGELAKVFLKLSEQIHPLVIGNVFRLRQQIQMLATTLLKRHFENDQDKMTRIINFLCSDSGSHDYPIFRREARGLGLHIETPSMEFYQKIKALYDDIFKELELNKAFDPNTLSFDATNTAAYSARRILIESVDGGTDVFVTEGQAIRNQVAVNVGPGLPQIMQTTIQDKRNFEGWRHE